MKKIIFILLFAQVFYIQAQVNVLEYNFVINLDSNFPTERPVKMFFDSKKSFTETLAGKAKTDYTHQAATDAMPKEKQPTIYKDLSISQLVSRDIITNKRFIVSEQLPAIKWIITKNKKKIGKYLCQEATCTLYGRDYLAYFTLEIPISNGPWKLHGLPGLILEAQTKNGEYQFNFSKLTLNDKTLINLKIEAPIAYKNQKSINGIEFVKLYKDTFKNGKTTVEIKEPDFTVNMEVSKPTRLELSW